ncbi:MAG: N-terminal phage integrase SAM-like domain-containing protein, partial [Oscillospiraceae bacterium]
MAKRRPSGDGMVRKKDDGRWEGRIVVGHKENGDSIFRYVYGKTQKELMDKLHRNIEQYADVDLTEDSRMTLGEWLDCWLDEYMTGTVRESTIYGYRMYANTYIKPILGNKTVSSITRYDVQKMYAKLKKEGRIHEHPQYGHALSNAMVRRIHAMFHKAMKM